jgi:molybdopterin molybdotransferase
MTIDVPAAAALVLESTPGPGTGDVERIPLAAAIDRACAAEVTSGRALPGEPLAVMDGFAHRASDAVGGLLEIVGESAAGHPFAGPIREGAAVRISTGAVVPPGLDVVTPREETVVEGGRVRLDEAARAAAVAGRYVREMGSDVRAREIVCQSGQRLGPGDLALLGSCGEREVAVYRKPRVAIVSSGDELCELGSAVAQGKIIETNAMMLAMQVAEAGGEAIVIARVPDRRDALEAAFSGALAADLVVGSGGISVGDHDHVLPVLQGLGFQMGFSRVTLMPGRPTTFGTIGDRPVFALAGNPASSFVGFELFVRAAVRKRGGYAREWWGRTCLRVKTEAAIEGAQTREVHARGKLVRDENGFPVAVVPAPKQASGMLRSLSETDCLVRLPKGTPRVEAGATVEVRVLRA